MTTNQFDGASETQFPITLLDLVNTLTENTTMSDLEVTAQVATLVRTGRIVLTGSFRKGMI